MVNIAPSYTADIYIDALLLPPWP